MKGVENMNNLLEWLKLFNSKERFFLTGYLLGNYNFSLCQSFRNDLSELINIEIPSDAFSAMDYHVDWLYASLNLARENNLDKVYLNKNQVIKAQQEDTDWLVAFKDQTGFHVILLEAKVTGGWSNKQMVSKAIRYREIFGENGNNWNNVMPHFVCLSPTKPRRLEINKWPQWMKPNNDILWLNIPKLDQLYKVTRCDENGLITSKGLYWKITER